jgi:hypothetical protein
MGKDLYYFLRYNFPWWRDFRNLSEDDIFQAGKTLWEIPWVLVLALPVGALTLGQTLCFLGAWLCKLEDIADQQAQSVAQSPLR